MSSTNPNDLLSAYYDREAAPNEEPAAKALVEGSPEAGREVKDYQRLSRLIQELPRLAAPPEFAAAVMQRAERESLIPLDPVASPASAEAVQSGRGSLPRPGRRWILAAAVSVSAAAALLIAVSIFRPSAPRGARDEFASRDRRRPLAAVETRKLSTASAGVLAANRKVSLARNELGAERASNLAIKNAQTGAPAAAATRGQTAAAPLGLMGAPIVAKDAAKGRAEAAETSGKSRELALILPANLKTAKVGDVVEALQQDGQQVAVVRLTVVNQVEGLDGVQSLLVRNTSRTLQNVDEIKRMRQQFAADKLAEVPKGAVTSAPGDLICVYVEGSRDEMLGVLQDLKNESHIQAAELTNTISFTTLEKYASRAVSAEKQSGEQPAADGQIAKGPVVPAPQASGSQLAVSLPASTVNQIFAARQSPAQVVQQLPAEEVNASSRKRNGADQPKGADSADRGQSAVAARRPVAGQTGSRSVAKQTERSQSRDTQEVAAAQKSFQIFFVITDQPQVQTPRPALGAAKSAARPVTRSAAGQTGPATPSSAKSAPLNRAP